MVRGFESHPFRQNLVVIITIIIAMFYAVDPYGYGNIWSMHANDRNGRRHIDKNRSRIVDVLLCCNNREYMTVMVGLAANR